MSTSDSLSDNEVAFAAINLFANSPTGPEPDWLEIEDWRAGALSAERAEQVLSHIANNPDIFQKWQDICEADEWLEKNPLEAESVAQTPTESQIDSRVATEAAATTEAAGESEATAASTAKSPSKSGNPAAYDLVGWIRKAAGALTSMRMPAIGGAVAATLLAVLVVPKLMNNTPPIAGDMVSESLAQYSALGAPLPQTVPLPRKTRSLSGVLDDLSDDEVAKHQLSLGLKQGFTALNVGDVAAFASWYESLPDDNVDCSLAANAEFCTQISADAATLGQWALVNQLACRSGATLPKDFQARQKDAYAALSSLDTLKQSTLLSSLLPSDSKQTTSVLCSVADKLIATASE